MCILCVHCGVKTSQDVLYVQSVAVRSTVVFYSKIGRESLRIAQVLLFDDSLTSAIY
jgi:hypothetical protein